MQLDIENNNRFYYYKVINLYLRDGYGLFFLGHAYLIHRIIHFPIKLIFYFQIIMEMLMKLMSIFNNMVYIFK